jgi:hypothetical protein
VTLHGLQPLAIGVEEAQGRGVVLRLGRRRAVRDRDDAADAGDSTRQLVELALDPEQPLRLDIVEPVEYQLAARLEPKELVAERAVLPVHELAGAVVGEDHRLGLGGELRHEDAAVVDPVPHEDLVRDPARMEPVERRLRQHERRPRIGAAVRLLAPERRQLL